MLRAPPSPDPKVTVEFIDRQLARDNPYVQFKLGRMLLRGELFAANPRLGFAVSRVAADRPGVSFEQKRGRWNIVREAGS